MLIGIVGKANVGKSTFFKALTNAEVLIGNYPFATIKPNHGIAFTKIDCICGEFNTQCNPRVGKCIEKKRFVAVEVMDVAGLVPGAHEGKGMGNQFLDDLRQADAFIHVVDMSGTTNEKGEPTTGYQPENDIRFLEIELDRWILSIINKGWQRFARKVQQEHSDIIRELAKQLSGLKVTEEIVKLCIKDLELDPKKPSEWPNEKLSELAINIRKITKPLLIVANKMDVPAAEENLKRCKELFPKTIIIPTSADTELALKEAANKKLIEYNSGDTSFKITGDINDKQKAALEFMQKNVLDKWQGTGVQKAINTAVFDLLKYIAVFPAGMGKLGDQFGNILPDCFLLPQNTTALQFAEHIHTDLAKKFIAAMDCKTKRKIGKETQLKHRDAIEILTSK